MLLTKMNCRTLKQIVELPKTNFWNATKLNRSCKSNQIKFSKLKPNRIKTNIGYEIVWSMNQIEDKQNRAEPERKSELQTKHEIGTKTLNQRFWNRDIQRLRKRSNIYREPVLLHLNSNLVMWTETRNAKTQDVWN